VNDFTSEEEANEFAQQWSGSSIRGETIKCVVSASKHEEKKPIHSPQESLASGITPTSNKQHETQVNREARRRQDNSKTSAAPSSLISLATNEAASIVMNDVEEKPPSVVRSSTKNQKVEDKRPLCRYANKGICRSKSNECKFRHQRCKNFETCSEPDCDFSHAKREFFPNPRLPASNTNSDSSDTEENEPNQYTSNLVRPRSDSLLSLSSTQSINIKTKPCRNGIKCFNMDCRFDHPDGWDPCSDGTKCENYDCTANHPFKRKKKCRDGARCKKSNCKQLHPTTRVEKCPFRAKCKKWHCLKLHPRSRARLCTDKENCTNLACLCIHPPERAKLLCSAGADCRDLSCKLNHPSERPTICDQLDTCSNFNCTRLHGPDWNPCEAGDNCDDEHCLKFIHLNTPTILRKKQKSQLLPTKIKTRIEKQRNF
jgi:hypothetical protein